MNLVMRWIDYWNRRVRKCTIFDVKLAQGWSFFCALILAKLIPQIMEVSIWWFVALAVLCVLRPLYVLFGKRDEQQDAPADG